ncbi:MAG: CocE/NonD family hydrolase [Chthoniobacterales bacterium]
MEGIYRLVRASILAVSATATFAFAGEPTQDSKSVSEIPPNFTEQTGSFEYVRRTEMVPMRDGVKLYTVILIPRGAKRAPILLSRTPYDAAERTKMRPSEHLATVLGDSDVVDDLVLHEGYIRVLQDVRGKYHSEGDYLMNPPPHGTPINPTNVDDSTDAYDTIDWLVKNTPESNGKVGILGISYDGFTTLAALIHPHPALRAAMPINPMVDGWMGDDWFHQGAFRELGIDYYYGQEAARDNEQKWWSDHFDDYESWLAAGSVDEMARRHGLDQVGFYRKIKAHPAYDSFWQAQAMDKLLAKEPVSVPVMLVDSLWDQEDIYGAVHVYAAIKQKDTDHKVFLVLGPWFHHQARLDGSAIGPIKFGSDTAAYFREHLVRPFFDHFLKDDAPPADLAPVTAFETGTNRWERLPTWPATEDHSEIDPASLFLQPNGKLGFNRAPAAEPGFDEYISDPAKPVPFLPRPIHIEGEEGYRDWQTWLVRDQREASGRTDVLTYTSDVLTAPLKISGTPAVNLIAATTGTDGDFVVKLIDVYPDENGRDPNMGGYQLMISADIFRGRYYEGFDNPKPIPANEKVHFRFELPTANHVFLPGHRLMVQVQSSWFPLYDRNPQTYVDNIFLAKPTDYKKATIRVFNNGQDSSFLELPVVAHQ